MRSAPDQLIGLADQLQQMINVVRANCLDSGAVDGDLLREAVMDCAPNRWSDSAVEEFADQVLARAHQLGIRIYRGEEQESWTPPERKDQT